MSSATTLESEVDITNAKKQLSSSTTKAGLNPDAAVFETSSLNKELIENQEEQALPEKAVEEMPSPQPLPAHLGNTAGGSVTVNGGEQDLFPEKHSGLTGLPDHIKPDQLPKHELKSLIRQQLEYYFSRENLAGDTYLVSQMDSDQYVSIQIVANFNQMKKLTSDIELVKEAIKESAYLQMDELLTKMRPNMKRCIVILREVPESTSVEEVEELFSGEGCPKYISCEPAHNNYWYIQFESEEDAQNAYRYLREDVRTFKGKPIMARIKAKPIPRTSTSGFVPKNGIRHLNETSPIPATPYRYPISPLYTGHQAYPYFHPAMVSQWAAGQPYFDPTLIPALSNNTYHGPHSFSNINSHQGSRPYFQSNRNRNQTRSYREQSDQSDKEASPPYRPRAHSTNGTTNTTNTPKTGTSNSTNWRKQDDDYRRLNSRTRRRRGSSEDIRSTRSPVPQEPMRSKDDSFQINLTSSQFPPLPSASSFKTTDLPQQSTTKQEYNKVASSPPLSPPVTPTKVNTGKPEKEDIWKKPVNHSNDQEVKKDETKRNDNKKSNETKPKNTKSLNVTDSKKETAVLSEKMSYAQIAQKKGVTPKVNQTSNVSSVNTSVSTTTVSTVAQAPS